MHYPFFSDILADIDRSIEKTSTEKIPELFRKIPLEVFGSILLQVPDEYTNLKLFLPKMPSDEVQRNWTGSSGEHLLTLSCAFVKSMLLEYSTGQRKPIDKANILDYGCGWGRLTRLLYKYTPFNQIYSVDPWDESIRLCRESGLRNPLAVCDYVPTKLPFSGVRYDLIFAFSVFSHLSEHCHHAVLATLGKYIAPGGLLAITVRPQEYWHNHQYYPERTSREEMIQRHRDNGYAFIPHNREPINGDVTYGDTSVSLDYIKANWNDWEVVTLNTNIVDPLQVIVFLRPRQQHADSRGLLRRLWQ